MATRLQSSDETAVGLLSVSEKLQMRELRWEDPVETYPANLLAFRIVAAGDDVARRDVQKRTPRPYRVPEDVLDGNLYGGPPAAESAPAAPAAAGEPALEPKSAPATMRTHGT